MNKSIFERIFPHSPDTVLPRYHDYDDRPRPRSAASTPSRVPAKSATLKSSPGSTAASQPSLKAAPLSASIVHYDDPFLPVERAARALQDNIQAFLDAQSKGLHSSVTGADDLSSVGSPTPTPSVATPTRSHAGPRVVPIRQPKTRKITLRGARKGLARAMDEFVQLKDEELRIIDGEASSREAALQQTKKYEDKRQALQSELDAVKGEDTSSGATALRAEAGKVEAEIHELENRLMELRTRHRHLVGQAEQIENSLDSKLSSYHSSLTLVDKDVKQFLRNPPVSATLSNFDGNGNTRGGMYALKPDRRTLEMAQDQWSTEQNSLSLRKADVEAEREALEDGAELWRSTVEQISDFERDLRHALKDSMHQSNSTVNPAATLLTKIESFIASVSDALATAETKHWNLLICALGAELEALEQGRLLLGDEPKQPTPPSPPLERTPTNVTTASNEDPPADLLGGEAALERSESNESLKVTLEHLSNGVNDKGKSPIRNELAQSNGVEAEDPWAPAIGNAIAGNVGRREYRSESEDDEPGPDFLVSHS